MTILLLCKSRKTGNFHRKNARHPGAGREGYGGASTGAEAVSGERRMLVFLRRAGRDVLPTTGSACLRCFCGTGVRALFFFFRVETGGEGGEERGKVEEAVEQF